jgi:hypothetical protein
MQTKNVEHNWTVQDISSQEGRLAVITGATSGVGFYTAKELATQCRPGRAPSGPCTCGQRRSVARRLGPLRGTCSGRRSRCTRGRVGGHGPWLHRRCWATGSLHRGAESDWDVPGRTLCRIRESTVVRAAQTRSTVERIYSGTDGHSRGLARRSADHLKIGPK